MRRRIGKIRRVRLDDCRGVVGQPSVPLLTVVRDAARPLPADELVTGQDQERRLFEPQMTVARPPSVRAPCNPSPRRARASRQRTGRRSWRRTPSLKQRTLLGRAWWGERNENREERVSRNSFFMGMRLLAPHVHGRQRGCRFANPDQKSCISLFEIAGSSVTSSAVPLRGQHRRRRASRRPTSWMFSWSRFTFRSDRCGSAAPAGSGARVPLAEHERRLGSCGPTLDWASHYPSGRFSMQPAPVWRRRLGGAIRSEGCPPATPSEAYPCSERYSRSA